MFDELEELNFEILDKKISLEAGDFSDCPKQYLKRTKKFYSILYLLTAVA
jgi:hypothetical protein